MCFQRTGCPFYYLDAEILHVIMPSCMEGVVSLQVHSVILTASIKKILMTCNLLFLY